MPSRVTVVLAVDAFRQAEKFLAGVDGDWARHVQAIGPCRHESKPAREPYEAPTAGQMRGFGQRWTRWPLGICGGCQFERIESQEPECLRLKSERH